MTSEEAFVEKIGNPALWIPGEEKRSHREWISNLTCTLLESGAVRDEVLLLLMPICKAKVIQLTQIFMLLFSAYLGGGL